MNVEKRKKIKSMKCVEKRQKGEEYYIGSKGEEKYRKERKGKKGINDKDKEKTGNSKR